MADNQVEVSTEIGADAGRLYDMVSDLANMGEWSPEAQGGRWITGGGPVGRRSVLGPQPKRLAAMGDGGEGDHGRPR